MNLLKAFDSALTAFVNELFPYDFPLLRDPGEALEDEIVSKWGPAGWNQFSPLPCAHPFGYDHPCGKCGHKGGNIHQSTSGDEATSAGHAAPEVSPEEVAHPPEAVISSGHPEPSDRNVRLLARSIYENGLCEGLHAHNEAFTESDSYWPLIRTAVALIKQGWQQK